MSSSGQSEIFRLLDANFNRAREALRVLEDYARFVREDGVIAGRLKAVRHDLVTVTREIDAEAIYFRDTPNDPGTLNKTATELKRADVAEVVTAAGKRLGEALRAIEEYLKTISPAKSASVEAIRYRFYAIEQQIAGTLGRSDRFAAVRLYVLITESACHRPWLETAELALLGGADCLQLREKDLDSGELLVRARQLSQLCRKHGALFIVNDRPDIAVLSAADGVHLGQDDLPVSEARKIVGPSAIIGQSTHKLEQARLAVEAGADYIGVGPCFLSPTKPRGFVAGVDWLADVAREIRIPAVAIAGITAQNVDSVLRTGVSRIAVTAAVTASPDPQGMARELKNRLTQASTLTSTVPSTTAQSG